MTFLSGSALILWLIPTGLTAYGSLLTWNRFRGFGRKKSAAQKNAPPAVPISVLKPLKGVDPGLFENLKSFFEINYPCFELIFSVADPNDPAVAIVTRLQSNYPRVPSRLILGQKEVGINPKINNLVTSYEAALHDWILISDSNIQAAPSYLKDFSNHLHDGVGVITSVVSGRNSIGLSSAIESLHLDSFYSRAMVLLEFFGKPCVIGKSMLFRKSMADRFGGIRILSRYLHEDFMAGEAMRKLNLEVRIADQPVIQNLGRQSMRAPWSRHLRWGRIRKSQAPLAFFVEPFFYSWIAGIAGALFCSQVLGWSAIQVLGGHMALWMTLDLLCITSLGSKIKGSTLLLWPLREALLLPLWLQIGSGNRVHWRGQKLKLLPGGLLEADEKRSIQSAFCKKN